MRQFTSRILANTLKMIPLVGCLTLASTPAAAQDGCKMAEIGRLEVVLAGNLPLVKGKVGEHDILALLDTGAERTLVWKDAAEKLGMRPVYTESWTFQGIGGKETAYQVTMEGLSLGSYAVEDRRWLVAGRSPALDANLLLLLGNDFFSKIDAEYDLANRAIRLWYPQGCERTLLAHWSKDFFMADFREFDRSMIAVVEVNGVKLEAVIDTGAEYSVMSVEAARQAKVDIQDPEDGGSLRGLGRKSITAVIARLDSFTLGEMTVKNPKMRIADLNKHENPQETGTRVARSNELFRDMLLGADFFRANRVLVSNSQRKLYFTHNGGPIFQITDERPEDAAKNGADKSKGN